MQALMAEQVAVVAREALRLMQGVQSGPAPLSRTQCRLGVWFSLAVSFAEQT